MDPLLINIGIGVGTSAGLALCGALLKAVWRCGDKHKVPRRDDVLERRVPKVDRQVPRGGYQPSSRNKPIGKPPTSGSGVRAPKRKATYQKVTLTNLAKHPLAVMSTYLLPRESRTLQAVIHDVDNDAGIQRLIAAGHLALTVDGDPRPALARALKKTATADSLIDTAYQMAEGYNTHQTAVPPWDAMAELQALVSKSNPAIIAADKELAKLKAQDNLLNTGNWIFGGDNRRFKKE